MGIILLLLALFLMYKLLSAPAPTTTKKHTCFNNNQWHHTWIWRDEGTDHEYMVCEKCGMLPGGDLYEVRD